MANLSSEPCSSRLRKEAHVEPHLGAFYNGIAFAIRVESKYRSGTLNDVLIHDHREGETVSRVIRVEQGTMVHKETGSQSPDERLQLREDLEQPTAKGTPPPHIAFPSNGRI